MIIVGNKSAAVKALELIDKSKSENEVCEILIELSVSDEPIECHERPFLILGALAKIKSFKQ